MRRSATLRRRPGPGSALPLRGSGWFATWPPAQDVPAFRGQATEGKRCAAKVIGMMVVLVALATAAGYLLGDSTGIDRAVSDWFVSRRSGGWNGLTRALTRAADTLTVVTIGLIVTVTGFLRKSRNGLIVLAVGMFGEVLMFLAITAFVSRPRPDVVRLDAAPPTSSFPSGHTFASVVLWGCLAVVARRCDWRRWIRAVLVVMALLVPVAVALSRLYRGMHHLSDVLASFVLGWLWLAWVVRLLPLRAASVRNSEVTAPR